MKNKLFLSFFKLAVTLMIAAFCVIVISKKFHQTQITTINQLLPSSYQPLWQASQGHEIPPPDILQHFLTYYTVIGASVGSERANAYALSAFCCYYLKNEQKAIHLFEKANYLQPDFFWNYFNLGVIYFNSGQFEKAGAQFQRALSLDPKKTLMIALSSKIYVDLFGEIKNTGLNPGQMLLEGYNQAFEWQILCYKNMGETAKMMQTINSAAPRVRIF